MPKDYALSLHSMVQKRRFSKALKPIVESGALSISVSPEPDFPKEKSAVVDVSNLEGYLNEREKILPGYLPNHTYLFTGEIV